MLYIKLFIEREKNTGQSAPECPFNGDRPSQWEMANFDPSQNRNPSADCNKIPHNWIRLREDPRYQIWYKSIHRGLLGIWVKYNVFVPFLFINVKNFHGSLTTVVRAQNDTSKTANITDTIFDRIYWYSPYKRRRFENRWDQTFCILLITDVLSECKPPLTPKLETKVIQDSYSD